MNNDVNATRAAYLASPNPITEAKLIKELESYGAKIVWQLLRECHPEIVNEAIKNALRSDFNNDSKFSTFFYTIIRNACWVYLKRKKRNDELHLPLDGVTELAYFPDPDTKILIDQLKRLLREEERQLFELKLEGWSREEMARKLGVSATTVDRQVSRMIERDAPATDQRRRHEIQNNDAGFSLDIVGCFSSI